MGGENCQWEGEIDNARGKLTMGGRERKNGQEVFLVSDWLDAVDDSGKSQKSN